MSRLAPMLVFVLSSNVHVQRRKRKLRELVDGPAAAVAAAAATAADAVSGKVSERARPAPSASSSSRTGTRVTEEAAPATASDGEALLLQRRIQALEDRLKDIEAARASGLEHVRLTLQDGDARQVFVVPLLPTPRAAPSPAAGAGAGAGARTAAEGQDSSPWWRRLFASS